MKSKALKFGKHKGKTISDLIKLKEYDYIEWLYQNVEKAVTGLEYEEMLQSKSIY
jgi:hypothetical protein